MAYKNQHRGDEFYTLREDVIKLCSQYLDDFKKPGVRVLCPCDTDESEFVKFFLEHDIDVTWSNELRYEQFDFSEFDWVVTNPPFSRMSDFMNRIADAGCGGLVIAPLASLGNQGCERLLRAGWHAYDEGVPDSFRLPDGSVSQFGWVVILTHRADWVHAGSKKRQGGLGNLPRTPWKAFCGIVVSAMCPTNGKAISQFRYRSSASDTIPTSTTSYVMTPSIAWMGRTFLDHG